MLSFQRFLVFLLVLGISEQVKIKCYDCVTPLGVNDVTTVCNSSLYCKGVFCTKGPDALSNGIYHGCTDNPPLDDSASTCKTVSNTLGTYENCYCKNIDFCNEAPNGPDSNFLLIALLVLLTFFYAFA